ncbi:MAG: hypothetical protein QXW74_03275 [Archaeoglobaceae archaeon]
MDFAIRDEIARKLKKRFRVVSPYKVGIGWVDIAILGKESVGIDFCENYKSSVERLNSFPFKEKIIIGNCTNCIDLQEFCKSYGINLDNFETFESTLSIKKLEDQIVFLYIVKEALDDGGFEDLKTLGFATSYSRSKIEPKFFVSLTNDGYRIAKKIIYSRILAKERELRRLSNPLNYLIALGVSNSLSIKPEGFPNPCDFKSLLQLYRSLPINNFHVTNGHAKVMLCEFLVKSALNKKAVELAERLCEMGLATKFHLYSPNGDFIWEEYKFSREAVEFLIKSSFFSIDESLLEDIVSLLSAIQRRPEIKIGESLKKAVELGLLNPTKISFSPSLDEFIKVRIAILVEKILEKLKIDNHC